MLLFACGVSVLLAANFWDTKSYTEWNDKQLQKILENSPWARNTPVNLRGDAGSGGGGGGGRSIVSFGFQRGGGGGSVPIPTAPKPSMVVVRWESALPIRQVLARQQYGDEVETSAEAIEYLGREPSSYVVRIVGIPAGGNIGTPEERAAGAQLVIRNQPPIQAIQAVSERAGRGVDLFLAFPKAPPAGRALTVADRQVQVVLDTEIIRVRRRFNLNDMIYQGELEL